MEKTRVLTLVVATFSIGCPFLLIDGRKLATQKLDAPKPGRFTDVTYAVPIDLTKGKQKVTVKFQAHPGGMAGGVFGCRISKGK